jgi:hypothetical protein
VSLAETARRYLERQVIRIGPRPEPLPPREPAYDTRTTDQWPEPYGPDPIVFGPAPRAVSVCSGPAPRFESA